MATARYRRAVVTGASSGIGRSLALWLAARGVTVIAAGRRREKLDELGDEAARTGGVIEPLELDVADVAVVRERLLDLDGRDGGLDLVVANAGVGELTPARNFDWEACDSILRVNVLGAAATLTAVLPGMVARGGIGKAEEIGALACYLCSDYAGFMTGTDVIIDGGWTAK